MDSNGEFFFTALGALSGFVSGVITATIHNALSNEKVDVFESGLHGAVGGAIAGAGVDVALLIVGSFGTAVPVVALAGTVAYVAGGLGNAYTTYASSGGTASDEEMVRSFHIGGFFNLVSFGTSWTCQASIFGWDSISWCRKLFCKLLCRYRYCDRYEHCYRHRFENMAFGYKYAGIRLI